MIGFENSSTSITNNNDTKLIWNQTNLNMNKLRNVHKILSMNNDQIETYIASIKNGQSSRAALDAIGASAFIDNDDNEKKQTQHERKKSLFNLDMNIFKISTDYCYHDSSSTSNDITKCDYLKRILHALRYYSLIKLDDKPFNNDILMSFCDNIYPQLIDDYNHVICKHSDDLEDINDQLIKDTNYGDCDHKKCKLFARYYDNSTRKTKTANTTSNNNNNNNNEITDSKLLFKREIFDNIHHWLFHLYHVGMRTKKKSIFVDQDDDYLEEDEQDEYIDHQFKKIKEIINFKKASINIKDNRFDDKNNKYTINTQKTEKDGNETFIDSVLECLNRRKISTTTINKLSSYLEQEEFDTDSLMEDMYHYQHGSNVATAFRDQDVINTINTEVLHIKSMLVFACILFIF